MIRSYVLDPSENHRIPAIGGPLADADPALLLDKLFAVVEVEGQLVGYWMIWTALHLEPLWIQPAHRQHPGVGRALLQQTLATARATGERSAFVVVDPAGSAQNLDMAQALGFQRAPDQLYYLVMPPVLEPAGVA